MPIPHLLLALLVVIIWGLNFIFVKLALDDIAPLFLCAIRFFLASVPAIFFVKLPKTSLKMIMLYGLTTFALQFSLLFTGMHMGMPPGLASLVLQVQIFFSMFFAAILLGERPSLWQIIGAFISFSGIVMVGSHLEHNTSILGFILILASAAAWGTGNLITKKMGDLNIIALITWGAFMATPPMFLLSLIVEGPAKIMQSYHQISVLGMSSVMYIVYLSTWIGYGTWSWLLSRHSVSVIVPFTLLVPIVGMLSASLILNEPFEPWKLAAATLVIGGLCINLLGARFATMRQNRLIKTKNA